MIEARRDVAFQDPFRAVRFAEQEMTLLDGIRTAAFPAEAVGMAVGLRFRDRVEAQKVQGLLGPIDQGGHIPSALPLPPNSLRDS